MKKAYYRLVFFYLSTFLMMIGVVLLLPLLVIPFYPEELSYAPCFVLPGVFTIFVGYLVRFFLKDTRIMKLEKNYDSLLLVLI